MLLGLRWLSQFTQREGRGLLFLGGAEEVQDVELVCGFSQDLVRVGRFH